MKENNFEVVVMAAGKGTRMGNDLPKVLTPLKGRPMMSYLLDAIKESGVCDRPTIVIGKGAEQVKETFGPDNQYVLQEEQLGTGHAVMVTEKFLQDATDVLVLSGDHPLIGSETIKSLTDTHLNSGGVLTIATVMTEDFKDWRSELKSMAKVIRNDEGKVIEILEKEDFTPETENIKEINPSYMCFKADWLWESLKKLGKADTSLNEYPLPALVNMAFKQGHGVTTLVITDTKQGLGINTSEQLESIENLL